jgi:hypothetical protein
MANADHLKVLEQGVDAWNAWRRESSVRPDLRGADLWKPNLGGADLHEADLERFPVWLNRGFPGEVE